MEIVRRTFEALKYPKGLVERARLNLESRTSEYMPSYRYAVLNALGVYQTFRTKSDAAVFAEKNT